MDYLREYSSNSKVDKVHLKMHKNYRRQTQKNYAKYCSECVSYLCVILVFLAFQVYRQT